MGLYNFKEMFVPFIRDGTKTHTIRAVRALPDVPGNTMHLYTGLRQPGAELIGRVPCIKVEPIRITWDHVVIIGGVKLDRDEKDLLAWRDGFRLDETVLAICDPKLPEHCGCFELLMLKFWEGRLPFEGHIYYWRWPGPAGAVKPLNGHPHVLPEEGGEAETAYGGS